MDDPSFRSVADALGLGVAFQVHVPRDRATRRFTWLGAACEALTGVPVAEALADSAALYDLVIPEHRERLAAAEAEALARGGPFQAELAMRRRDGEVRWFRLASTPRILPDGSTLWDGLQIDITEARRTAEELEEQRRRVELAVEATGLGLWEWDVRSGVLSWSARNRALFHVSPDADLTLRGYVELIHADDRERVRQAYAAARDVPDGGEFAVEYRILAGEDERWILAQGRVLRDGEGPRLVVGTSLDVTERRRADAEQKLLVGELAHRAKNGLTIIQAIVAQTARSAESVQAMADLVNARMQAMADAQDLVTEGGGRAVRLDELAARVLSPFDLGRFDLDPDLAGLTVSREVAGGVALLLHELATNAVKYGALSAEAGRVAVTRGQASGRCGALVWRETGGPPPAPGDRRGFGSRLLESALRPQGGEVAFDFEPEGFRARMAFPTET